MISDVRFNFLESDKKGGKVGEPELNEKNSTMSCDSFLQSPRKKREQKAQAKLSLELVEKIQPSIPIDLSPDPLKEDKYL